MIVTRRKDGSTVTPGDIVTTARGRKAVFLTGEVGGYCTPLKINRTADMVTVRYDGETRTFAAALFGLTVTNEPDDSGA